MKKLTTFLFACLTVMMVQAQVQKPQPTNPSDAGTHYINPIVRADFPDPDVIRVGSTYYMVSTTMCLFPGATILKSEDLVNWEYCAQPLKQLLDDDRYNLRDGKNAYAKGMWASSMKYHNGKFYLLINGNDNKAWLLSAANPEGEWEVRRLSRNYYDPGMLFDGDKVYIACGYNHISMCELDADFNFVREQEVVVRENSGLEGCHLYKIGDYYYIYATYGGFPSGQAAFRSKNIFGPFEEKVLVEKNYDGKINTIHQGALFEDIDGKWWTVMQEDLGALGRFPNLLPVTWQDGWPVVAEGKRPPVSFVDKVPRPVSADKRIKVLPTSDDFSNKELDMQWQWNHNPVPSAWSLDERPGWLRLKSVGIVQNLHQAQGMLTQRIFADKERPSMGTIALMSEVSRKAIVQASASSKILMLSFAWSGHQRRLTSLFGNRIRSVMLAEVSKQQKRPCQSSQRKASSIFELPFSMARTRLASCILSTARLGHHLVARRSSRSTSPSSSAPASASSVVPPSKMAAMPTSTGLRQSLSEILPSIGKSQT